MIVSRKLRPYFQVKRIVALTDQPLRKVLHHLDLNGGMTSWSVELGEFDIRYHLRTAIKGQTLLDFITGFKFANQSMAEEDLMPRRTS